MRTPRSRAAASRLAQALNRALDEATRNNTTPPRLEPGTREDLVQTFRIATGFPLEERAGRFFATTHPINREGEQR